MLEQRHFCFIMAIRYNFPAGAQTGLRAATRELLYTLSNQLESMPQQPSNSKTLSQKPLGKRKAIEHPVEAAHPVAPGAKKPKTSVTGTSLPPAAEVADGSPGLGPANKARQKRTRSVASVDGIAAAPSPGSWQQNEKDSNIVGGNLKTKSLKKKKIQAAQDLAVDAEVVDNAAKRTLAAIGTSSWLPVQSPLSFPQSLITAADVVPFHQDCGLNDRQADNFACIVVLLLWVKYRSAVSM